MTNETLYYLDHAAATPLDERVEDVMRPFYRAQFFNASSPYAPAVQVRRAYEDARHRLAVEIGAQADDVLLTAGATESINIALTAAKGGHVATTAIEHAAVLEAAKQYGHTIVTVPASGIVDPAIIREAIRDDTQLVSVSLANNELGTIQPLREIAEVLQQIRRQRQEQANDRPLWLHADASQGVGQIDVNVGRLGVDLMTINSGKIYGPKQVGLLWRRPGVMLSALIVGGGQESGLRSGTENVAGVVGFAKALELVNAKRKHEVARLSELRDDMQKKLADHFGESIQFFGHQKHRLASHLSLSFPGLDAERLLFLLEAKHVLLSTGSACAANKSTGSYVLRAIGASEDEVRGSLRVSLGALNETVTVTRATELIIETVDDEYRRVRR